MLAKISTHFLVSRKRPNIHTSYRDYMHIFTQFTEYPAHHQIGYVGAREGAELPGKKGGDLRSREVVWYGTSYRVLSSVFSILPKVIMHTHYRYAHRSGCAGKAAVGLTFSGK